MSEALRVAPEIGAALREGRGVVALETTLVTHGFPPPLGLEVALSLEAEVRAAGAVPATVAVLDGRLRVGLGGGELERLAEGAEKVSLANLAAALAGGRPGSTTVAATLFAAHRAGIHVFATGGIGGVHRASAESGDVSADLTALSRFPVAVVCSGAKAILDLPKTVEALETLGVPVYGFGTDRFPGFYRRGSELPVDRRYDSVEELAAAVREHLRLGVGTGVVIGNPIPAAFELPLGLIEGALTEALSAAEGARGRDVTPRLLERLRKRSGGRSIEANRALLLGNARLAATLARAL
jgi:pseudouridine-5'-phosphate glycosidase